MKRPTEQTIMMWLSCLGLTGLLIYTFVHTGGLLARYVAPWSIGYIAAFGIELMIVAMSYRLASLKRVERGNGFLLFLLIAALFVSAFANIDEGHLVRYGEHVRVDNIGELDPIQAVIGLSATGLISLLVFAISEIFGSDVNTVRRATERTRKQGEQAVQSELLAPEQEQTPITQEANGDYQQAIYSLLDAGQSLGPRPMADVVGCSPATASKWIKEYNRSHANGKGA